MENNYIQNLIWNEDGFVFYLSKTESKELSLQLENGNDKLLLTASENKYEVSIFNKNTRSIIKPGRWILASNAGEKILFDDSILLNLEDYNKVFYSKDYNTAIEVTFLLIDDKISSITGIVMEISYMIKYEDALKTTVKNAAIESNNYKQFVKRSFLFFSKWILNKVYQFLVIIHKKNGHRVLFMSENRTAIIDNLESINNRMKERGLDKDYEISYSFRNIFSGRQNPFSWLNMMNIISKQDYIFVDDYVPIFAFLNIDTRTTLVQTWHAGFGFKLVGYGRFGIEGSPHPVKSCHRKYDYALVGNNGLKEIYSEVFGIEERSLLATGMPRLEHFLDEKYRDNIKNSLYEEYPMLKEKYVITFAPTYRGYDQGSANYDFTKLDFDKIYDFCKEKNAIFIIKQHHFLTKKMPIKENQKDVFLELSNYKLNDLFYITDVLITDYSSCFYDFLLLDKPVIFYVYDKAYYSATRGVHRPIDDVAPGMVCDNFEQLLCALNETEKNVPIVKDFLIDNCKINNKLASDQVIDYILLKRKFNE